ncbi:LURP-one-related/scramblase family protein [Vagococcus xieshaowenii]|uniref:Uncharacterized protein n=1 Tax=Vagococcus xieshaowenii TaxID=2562451 RepID=A0AAJ5JLB6_9ENTE|nr:hypothetical protein [Vagococcus xieshaowenii]QCA29381.1 hypothetical protein E4Z98_08635 [Vagococcus xieshaowenii]TFZ39328.1 hypothetical protein E4031_09290 [Vagococcus xieshaowenii]
MGHYYIQENMLATNTPTVVKDESGKQCYLIVGKWGSKGDVLSIFTMKNELIVHIKQESFGMRANNHFSIYFEQKKIATLKHLLSFKRDYYFVTQLSWLVTGNIPKHQYKIYQFNQTIMKMNKTYLAQGNFYELEISKDEFVPICLGIACLLDYWQLNRSKELQPVLAKNKLGWAYKLNLFKD